MFRKRENERKMRARDEEKANTLYNKNNSIKEMIPHEKKNKQRTRSHCRTNENEELESPPLLLNTHTHPH